MQHSSILDRPELVVLSAIVQSIINATPEDCSGHDDGLAQFAPSLSSFACSSEPGLLVRELLAQFERGSLRIEARGNTLILAESRHFVLTISSFDDYGSRPSTILDDGAGDMITSHPSSSLVANIGQSAFSFDLHSIPDGWGDGLLPTSGARLGPPRTIVLEPGRVAYLDARRDIPDLRYAGKTLLVARISSKNYQPLACSIDRRTGDFRMLSCTVPAIARIPLAMKVLRAYLIQHWDEVSDDTKACALDTLERYRDHRLHFFRWGALQALAALDAERAIPWLRHAVNDPHAHVRRAATAALDMVGGAA